MGGRISHGRTAGSKTRSVRGESVASAGFVLALGFAVVGHGDRGIADAVVLEEVSQVQFGRGAGLDADGCAVQFLGRGNAEVFLHHEALTVIVVDGDEIELEVVVAAEGPGRVADQKVDFARSQRGEAGFARGRDELDLGRVTQNSGGNGTAQIDVKAGPVVVVIRSTKAGQTGVGTAKQLAARLDVVKRSGRCHASNHGRGHKRAVECGFFHSYLFLSVGPS